VGGRTGASGTSSARCLMSVADVSVVIPVRNRARQVVAAVRSALDQSPLPREIIVVDDASTDGSGEAAAALGDAVTVISLSSCSGPAAARNVGVAAARGSYIAFLDSDDRWLPGCLAARLDTFAANSDLSLVWGDAVWAGGGPADGTRLLGRDPLLSDIGHFEQLIRGNVIITSTTLVRRADVVAVGGFPEEMHRCEDYHLWLRLAWHIRERRAFAFVDRALARYWRSPDGLSADDDSMQDGEIEALSRLIGLEGLEPRSAWARSISSEIVRRRIERAYDDLLADRKSSARRKLIDALRRGGVGFKVLRYLLLASVPFSATTMLSVRDSLRVRRR